MFVMTRLSPWGRKTKAVNSPIANLTNISSNNKIFNIIKNDYNDFGKWYNKLLENNEECYFTKDKDGIINSILILKVGENDSQQIEEKNVLKIRTFNVIDKNM